MIRTAIPIRRAFPVAAAAGLLALTGCGERSNTSWSSRSPQRMNASELSQYAATAGPIHAVNVSAPPPASGRKRAQTVSVQMAPTRVAVVSPAPPVPPSQPDPPANFATVFVPVRRTTPAADGKPTVYAIAGIKLVNIHGDPKATDEEAKDDAVRKAKAELTKRLEKLDPPVTISPSLARVQAEYIPVSALRVYKVGEIDKEMRKELVGATDNADWYVAEVNVELTDDQVRQLRQEERVQTGLIGVGGLAVGAFALFGVMRVGSAAGRLTRGRTCCGGKFLTFQILFWTIGPPLLIYLLWSR